MSRVYAKVSIEMWGDKRFKALSPLRPSGQALWLYLLAGRFRTSIPGLNLNIGLGALSDRLQWRIADVERHWNEIVTQGMAEADWPAGVVWLPKGIDHNPPESPNVVKGWGKVVLPECPLITKALATLEQWLQLATVRKEPERLSEAYAKAFRETFKKDIKNTFRQVSPNQEQEQEQEVPPQPPSGEGGARSGRFTRLELAAAREELAQFRATQPLYVAPTQRVPGVVYREPQHCPHGRCAVDLDCLELIAADRRARKLRAV